MRTTVEAHLKQLLFDAYASSGESWTISTGDSMTLEQFLIEESVATLPAAFITFGACIANEDMIDGFGHVSDYEESIALFLLGDGPMRDRVKMLRDHFNNDNGFGTPDPNEFIDLDGKRRRLVFHSADGRSLQREGFRVTEVTIYIK